MRCLPGEAEEVGREVIAAPIRFTFPWPPTVNSYYRRVGGKTIISAEGRAFRQTVAAHVIADGTVRKNGTITCRIPLVAIYAWRPDRRRYDVDNLLKSLLDACTKARIWHDDGLIDGLTIRRRLDSGAPAHVDVHIMTDASAVTL